MKLKDKELLEVRGGASAAYISAWIKVFTTIIDFGRKIGSSLRRGLDKNYC